MKLMSLVEPNNWKAAPRYFALDYKHAKNHTAEVFTLFWPRVSRGRGFSRSVTAVISRCDQVIKVLCRLPRDHKSDTVTYKHTVLPVCVCVCVCVCVQLAVRGLNRILSLMWIRRSPVS